MCDITHDNDCKYSSPATVVSTLQICCLAALPVGSGARQHTSSPGDHSVWVPPDPISNSEVKPFCANDSVGLPHVKVGHRRVLFTSIKAVPPGTAFLHSGFEKPGLLYMIIVIPCLEHC